MDKKQLQLFQDVGLTEHEARVYLAALTLGPSTVMKIARLAEVKRTTVYSVIDALKQKGLMRVEMKGLKQLFAAEDPRTLERVLEHRKKELAGTMNELSALYNSGGGGTALKYYEGVAAIKSVYESFLEVRPNDKYYIVSSVENFYKQDRKWFEDFLQKRSKKNIKTKVLFVDSEEARQYKKYAKNHNSEVKILPKGTKISTNFVVVPDKVLIHQLDQPIVGIVIENKSAIQMHQEFFEIMWRSIEAQNKDE